MDICRPSVQEEAFLLPTAWALSAPAPAASWRPSCGFTGASFTARVNRVQWMPGPSQALLILALEVCSWDFVAGLVPYKPGSCHQSYFVDHVA